MPCIAKSMWAIDKAIREAAPDPLPVTVGLIAAMQEEAATAHVGPEVCAA
jgi:hypothetical protein